MVWLANALARYRGALGAGHLVLSGACTPAFPVAPGDASARTSRGLGWVAATFA